MDCVPKMMVIVKQGGSDWEALTGISNWLISRGQARFGPSPRRKDLEKLMLLVLCLEAGAGGHLGALSFRWTNMYNDLQKQGV